MQLKQGQGYQMDNNFDFSLYDNEDDSPIVQVKQPPQKQNQPKQKAEIFDFDAYDFSEPEQAASKSPQASQENLPRSKRDKPFETAPVSKEDYAKMSMSEKIQYAKDLEKEQRYESSRAFTKNAASALSFGFSEDIPGFKPEEGEDPVAGWAGTVAGHTPAILGAGKLVGAGLNLAYRNAPKVLQPLYRFLHAFGTGATVESGKQGANAIRGEEVNLSEIPIRGAEFAAFDTVIRGLGALGKKFLQISPAHQAQILEQGVIPSDLPKSQYETAEEVLRHLRQTNQAPNNFPRPGGPPPPPDGGTPPPGGSAPPARINPNRVRANGEDLGLRPAPQPQSNRPDLADSVGDIFSRERFYNTTQGGQAFKNEIMNIDEDVYRGVGELYNTSRALNSEINTIQPQLVNRLEARVAELSDIPEPSDVQRRLLRASQNVLNRLAQYENVLDEAGNVIGREITGYTPINNQTLIDQVQSLRQIIDYDFAHGNTKNIFRPLINDLQDAAIRSAEQMGAPEAAEALNEARSAYRAWVEAFDNDYIRPFRDASNQDFSKLFKSALDFDESNMIRNILNLSENGQRLGAASTREIVEKHLGKYFENPRSATPREFDKVVRELEAVITPEQAQQIRDQFREAQRRFGFRAREAPKRQPTNDERIAAKYEGKEPEDIQKLMNKRSGIKQLREDLNTPQKQATFQRLQQQKIRSILREGNIEKDFTGDDLYRFLNKEHNYELLSEMLGESETEAMRQAAKEIGKSQVKSELRKKNVSKAAHKVAAFKALEIILGIL